MNYLLTMTFSGTCICLMYSLLRKSVGEHLSEAHYYCLIKGMIIYFLVPLPFLRDIYMWIWQKTNLSNDTRVYIAHDELLLYIDEGYWEFNKVAKEAGKFLLVWFAGTLIICILFLVKYILQRRKLERCKENMTLEREQQILTAIFKEYPVKRKVEFVPCEKLNSAFNIGFFRPVIFYNVAVQDSEKRFMLAHEFVHVKRRDMFWKFAAIVVVIMHWYNPCAWWLLKEFEQVCEYSCDEQVLLGKEREVRIRYAHILTKCTQEDKKIFFHTGLSEEGKQMKIRIEKIMKNTKKMPVAAAVVLLGVIIALNSFTVLAYPKVKVVSNMVYEDGGFVKGDVAFIPKGEKSVWELPKYTFYFDTQFIDEEGNVYEVTEDVLAASVCVHEYINGELQKHVKNNEGGCSISFYEAMCCKKCNNIKSEKYIYDINYAVCIH